MKRVINVKTEIIWTLYHEGCSLKLGRKQTNFTCQNLHRNAAELTDPSQGSFFQTQVMQKHVPTNWDAACFYQCFYPLGHSMLSENLLFTLFVHLHGECITSWFENRLILGGIASYFLWMAITLTYSTALLPEKMLSVTKTLSQSNWRNHRV